MRRAWAVALACVLSLASACGDGSTKSAGGVAPALPARATDTSIADQPANAGPSSTPPASTGPTATGGPEASATTAPVVGGPAAAPASPETTAVSPTLSQATGLIHGTVERGCSNNPGAGGACYSQGGIAGAAVELRLPSGPMVATTSTDTVGVFEFRVSSGRYVIRETSSGVFQERDVPADRTTFVGLVVPPN